jgi:hypothetical protein
LATLVARTWKSPREAGVKTPPGVMVPAAGSTIDQVTACEAVPP